MTQVAPAEAQLLCHGGREGTAKWDLSPAPPGWDAGTLQLEVSKFRTLLVFNGYCPSQMPACMGLTLQAGAYQGCLSEEVFEQIALH